MHLHTFLFGRFRATRPGRSGVPAAAPAVLAPLLLGPLLLAQPLLAQPALAQTTVPGAAAAQPISVLYARLTEIERSHGSFAQREQMLAPVIDQVFDLPAVGAERAAAPSLASR